MAKAIPSAAVAARSPWRVIDIVVTSVLGVATGLIFVGWNFVGGAGYSLLNALTPGVGGLATGVWLLGGVLGGLVIRKPGAAVAVELIAAIVSALVGNQWGITTIYSGVAQGLGAELVFCALRYRRWRLGAAMLAGAGAGLGAGALELALGNTAKTVAFNVTYLICLVVSGAVLAGAAGRWLAQALAATGALSRFASGREARTDV